MDWGLIITNALRAMVGLDTVVFALAAIGLNVHFGYTGLLNFGQSAFLAVAGYGLAITIAEFGLPTLVGVVVGLVGAVLLEDVDQRRLVEQVAGRQLDAVLDLGDPLEVDGRRPAEHADHLVALLQQQLR